MKYYCGPVFIPNFIRKYFSQTFNEQCKLHDFRYVTQGADRLTVDRQFLDDMIEARPDKVLLAYLFYYSVRAYGWVSWYGKQILDVINYK